MGSGSFTTPSVPWSSVAQRIKNLENGVFALNSDTVRTIGGSVVVPSAASVVGLTVRATSGQTANLLEFRNSSNTVVSSITSSGSIVATIDGGTA